MSVTCNISLGKIAKSRVRFAWFFLSLVLSVLISVKCSLDRMQYDLGGWSLGMIVWDYPDYIVKMR